MMAEFQGYITVEAVVDVVTSLQEVKFNLIISNALT